MCRKDTKVGDESKTPSVIQAGGPVIDPLNRQKPKEAVPRSSQFYRDERAGLRSDP
jgi:hypothetical protein